MHVSMYIMLQLIIDKLYVDTAVLGFGLFFSRFGLIQLVQWVKINCPPGSVTPCNQIPAVRFPFMDSHPTSSCYCCVLCSLMRTYAHFKYTKYT